MFVLFVLLSVSSFEFMCLLEQKLVRKEQKLGTNQKAQKTYI